MTPYEFEKMRAWFKNTTSKQEPEPNTFTIRRVEPPMDIIQATDMVIQDAVRKVDEQILKSILINNYIPKNIFKNGLFTTVLWADGTKTIVKRGEDEPDDEYSAFTAALARKIYGTNSAVKRIVRMTKVQSKKNKERKEAVVEMTEQEFEQFGDNLIEKYSENDACTIDKPCEKSTVEHDLDAMNRHDEDWHEILDKLPDSEKEKLIETLLKEAEGRKYPPAYYIFKAMSGEKDKELEDRLNKQAKKQYEEYLKQNTANDMWTCPKCGQRYQWQYNAEGRYAFCPHCQLATQT
jgi:endogenous inhibitor of DNA gyrase (YacG/DUF329 family)